MTDSVRDLLIERMSLWMCDGDLDVDVPEFYRSFCEDLLDNVFCDPEIREAMVESLIWRQGNLTTGALMAGREGRPFQVRREVHISSQDYLMQLFGPVKETE